MTEMTDIKDARFAVSDEARAAKNRAMAEEDKIRAAARKKQETIDRFKPLLFIIATLTAWSVIIVLANVAVTCVPGGDACSAAGPFTPSTPMSRLQWVLTLVSGVAALWVSRMMVYPSREFPHQ